jgi:hypothetical protein
MVRRQAVRFHSTDDPARPVVVRRGFRLAGALAAAGILLGIGRFPGKGSTSRADDPPKPAELPDAVLLRISVQHDRFVRLCTPLADALDEAEKMKEQLPNQIIAVEGARAAYLNAKLNREVAEIALQTYEKGDSKQEEATVEERMKLARAALDRVDIAGAERRLEKTLAAQKAFVESGAEPAMRALGELLIGESVSRAKASVEVEKIRLKQAEAERDSAEAASEFLHRFSRPRRVAELRSDIEKARSDELAKERAWELAVWKQKKIENAVSAGPRSWTSVKQALLSSLAEVGDLEARRFHLLDDPDRPRPPDAEVQKVLDSIDAKLDEAERAADRVRFERTSSAFIRALTRVRDAAHRLGQKH